MKAMIAACAAVVCLGLALSAGVKADAKMAALAKKYSRATTERERMAIAIDAIDRGFIRPGVQVSDVDRIFGTNFAQQLPVSGEVTRGYVEFRTQGGTLTNVGKFARNWRLIVHYDAAGMVREYYLTNVGRE